METVTELVAWTGTQPATAGLDRAGAVALLPGDETLDAFTRLAALLLGYAFTELASASPNDMGLANVDKSWQVASSDASASVHLHWTRTAQPQNGS